MRKRFDIKQLLQDPKLRERLFTSAIIAIQARSGTVTSEADALRAYRKVRKEKLRPA